MRRRVGSISAELRREILERDKRCFLARLYNDHVCRDLWGNPHRSDDLDRLSLEHVKDQGMMGRRAPSDPAHLLALCATANINVPSKGDRIAMRAYLRAVNA